MMQNESIPWEVRDMLVMIVFLSDAIDKIACQSTNLCMDGIHCNATVDF